MKDINKLLGIKESYQAPAKVMEILYDRKRREELFMSFLEAFDFDVSRAHVRQPTLQASRK